MESGKSSQKLPVYVNKVMPSLPDYWNFISSLDLKCPQKINRNLPESYQNPYQHRQRIPPLLRFCRS